MAPDSLPPQARSSAPLWLGALIGASIGIRIDAAAALVGAAVGLGAGMLLRSKAPAPSDAVDRVAELEARIASLETDVAALKPRTEPPTAAVVALPLPVTGIAAPAPVAAVPAPRPPAEVMPPQPPAPPPPPARAPARNPFPALDQAITAARGWLFGGNTVARLGVVVLFIGIAFLLRYAAEHSHLPIELRLIGVAVLALAFLGAGWRMRTRRPGFALTLQGAAIGLLYMTAFAATRIFGVLPPIAALALMVALAALSGLIAVLQDGRALAALAALGGFAAPLLIASDGGQIAMLFAYFVILDLGVLGIALFRAWRELNWIAFLFTFAVSGLWAVQRYQPEAFALGQGYLVVFWALFLAVSVLFALRQPEARRGRFDTTLVFALPLAAFGVETRFESGVPLALAATCAAAVYLAISSAMLRRRDATLRLFVEAHFGIGVALLTAAVPLAASARWTAAAWALEGVATAWVGMRQSRALPLAAGLGLQAFAAIALLTAVANGEASLAPHWSGTTVNLLVLAISAYATARIVSRCDRAAPAFARLPLGHVAWVARAASWIWIAVALWQALPAPYVVYAWSAFGLALIALERRAIDRAGDCTSAPLTPEWVVGTATIVAAVLFAALFSTPADAPAVSAAAMLATRIASAAAALAAAVLSLGERRGRIGAAALLTLALLGTLVAVLGHAIARHEPAEAVAQIALLLLAPCALALGALAARLAWSWPNRLALAFDAYHVVLGIFVVAVGCIDAHRPDAYLGWVAWPIAWVVYYARFAGTTRTSLPLRSFWHVAGVWLLAAMVAVEASVAAAPALGSGWTVACLAAPAATALWYVAARPARWPVGLLPGAYRQVAAPGLAIFGLLWLVFGNLACGGDPAPLPAIPIANPMDLVSLGTLLAIASWQLADRAGRDRQIALGPTAGAAAFLVANILLLRALHFVAGVDWHPDAWLRSLLVQASLSILWTVIAMTAMLVAHRTAMRRLWIAGAALLGAVVVKLLLVDLSGRGTIERIVSFVVVGLLIMLIGYLTPAPPAAGRPVPAGGET
jgi:uncharacterized membrane protein